MSNSTITVTLNTYGHLFPSLDAALSDGLDEAYRLSLSDADNRPPHQPLQLRHRLVQPPQPLGRGHLEPTSELLPADLFGVPGRLDLFRPQGDHPQCFPVPVQELHLESFASPVRVHDRPGVPLLQPVLGKVPAQDDRIELQQRVWFHLKGYDSAFGEGEDVIQDLTVELEQDDGWFIATCGEVPGANGQGRSEEECLESLRQAVLLILEDREADEP